MSKYKVNIYHEYRITIYQDVIVEASSIKEAEDKAYDIKVPKPVDEIPRYYNTEILYVEEIKD